MERRRTSVLPAALAAAVVCTLPSVARAQDGAELMRRMQTRQAERLVGIDNVTITQDMMGATLTTYMEKRDVGGVVSLAPVTTLLDGRPMPKPPTDAPERFDAAEVMRNGWADRFGIVGHEEVDGRQVTVLEVTDFDGMPMFRARAGANVMAQTRPLEWRLYVDEGDMVVRKMEMRTEVESPAGVDTMNVVMTMEDYRTVDGYLQPYRTRMATSGMPGMDPETMRSQVEMMKKNLDKMPAAGRDMMKKAIDQMEARAAAGGEMVLTVTDLKVNAGPPGA